MGSMGKEKSTRVLIVGAGPVGLLTGLMLAKCGIQVDVLDAAMEIDPRPRGIAYGPPAVKYEFHSPISRCRGCCPETKVPGFYAVPESWTKSLREG